MVDFIIIAFACASISFTIACTGVFEKLREVLSKLHPMVDQLIHCPYCLNHYVVATVFLAGGFKSLFLTYTVIEMSIVNILLCYFAVIGAGSLVHFVLLRAYDPLAKAAVQRQIEAAKKKLIADQKLAEIKAKEEFDLAVKLEEQRVTDEMIKDAANIGSNLKGYR